jgi:hypothetical protein
VVRLVPVAQALEDLDRVRQRRLLDLDRLEPALQGGSFSTCLRYSSSVVAPIVCSSPAASIGLRMLAASIAPSAAPAPTRVWISSMNRMMSPRVRISLRTFFSRSSKSPR